MVNIIHYGIGKDYLPKWGVREALREIYQNFLDYGEFEETSSVNDGLATVVISNTYAPTDLAFLRIGTSDKQGNDKAIGKHGEGLKMAMLILARNNYDCFIEVNNTIFTPIFLNNGGVNDCFAIKTDPLISDSIRFTITYQCLEYDYITFAKDIIRPKDILFENVSDGKIVNRDVGRIYSGGLFVIALDKLSNAYDINPSNMQLDRDRSAPRSIDVNYHSSRLNAEYDKWELRHSDYSDTQHINHIPTRLKSKISVNTVGNAIVCSYKDINDKDVVITNSSLVSAIKTDSFFQSIIKRIKLSLIKHLGLYDMLLEFKQKYVFGTEATMEFDIILDKVKINN